jgi:hypothetical protein
MTTASQTILATKAALIDAIQKPLSELARQCAASWTNADALDEVLRRNITGIPNCHLLYAWNVDGIEVSSMVSPDTIDTNWRGTDLSTRPYLKNNLPFKGIMLSSVYGSMYTHKQCITALVAVSHNDELLGFVAADFAVNDLLKDSKLSTPKLRWQQFRGDPAIRGQLFMQHRVPSLLDAHIDEVLELITDLMCEHGVFHSKIHFSSGRCSFWLLDDPYNYRIHDVDEIIDPELCLAYPLHAYPEKATVSPDEVRKAMAQFKGLRFADETIYLRSASINIMNGMLGLTFSCDGSHYMPVREFIEKDMIFWLGALTGKDSSSESIA